MTPMSSASLQTPAGLRRSHPWTRVPLAWYTDPAIYEREQQLIFRGPAWSYAALSVELPETGSFKTTTIGDASIVLVRDRDGHVNAFENRCAHRGVQFCYKAHGTAKTLQCPYHQWTYNLQGELIGIPFRNGIAGLGGGMPDDFDLKAFPLTRLRVAERHGALFVTFSDATEPFEAYLGPAMLEYFDRIFDGRALTLLGYERQVVESNWKLEMENLKDPYHASLLHIFFATFGLFRLDQPAWVQMDDKGRHAIMAIAKRGGREETAATKEMSSFRNDITLQGPQLIQPVPEFPGRAIGVMQTLWPNLIIQQQSNTLAMRQIVSRGPGVFELHWTYFGYADDDAEMTARRLRQANLVGTAGYVSMDDIEVLEMQQASALQYPEARGVLEMGGIDTEDQEHHVTEVPVRAFWRYYREVMGL
jgi:salicylate 5-hydroxylase large subunit